MSANDPILDFAKAVATELGADAITLGEDVLARYAEHTLPSPDVRPGAVAYPDSTSAVQALVRLANQFRVQLYPISNGQNIGLGTRSPIRPGQVVVDLGLDDGPGGLQAGYSRELRARLDAEARAAIRDRKAPHPISQALQEADVPRLQAMADAAPGLLLEIDQARFKEESADTVAGKPARKLVFERGVDSLSDHDRKYAKHFTSTLTVWIAPDGTPLAESRREDFSGRAFVVVSFEQHDGEERRFGLLGDRLVTLHDEEHALAQGAGEREESRTERQLQLQP